MNTQYRKNLKDVATACKNYTDSQIAKAKDDLRWQLGTYDLSVDSVDGSTMLLPTPANATQMNINKVDGASEISENLAIFEDETITSGGLSFTFLNGVCNSSGTPSDTGWIRFKTITLPAGSYGYADLTSGTIKLSLTDANYQTKSSTFTLSETTTLYWSVTGSAINTYGQLVNSKPMLVKGSTAPTEFKVGYTGIHNIELTGIRSEGANLCNPGVVFADTVRESSTSAISNYYNLKLKPNTNYTLSSTLPKTFGSSGTNGAYLFLASGKITSGVGTNSNGVWDGQARTVTSDSEGYITIASRYQMVVIDGVTSFDNYNVMLNEGSTALPYEPYVSTTKTIDLSTILYNGNPLFEGNNLKGVGNVADEITPYKATKRIGARKISGLPIQYSSEYQVFYCNIDDKTGSLLLMAGLTTTTNTYDQMGDLEVSAGGGGVGVNFKDTSCPDIASFMTKYGDEYLNYELATPIEVSIDWSSKLSRQTCYSNGSTTLLNTNNQDTTSQIDYLIEEVKA